VSQVVKDCTVDVQSKKESTKGNTIKHYSKMTCCWRGWHRHTDAEHLCQSQSKSIAEDTGSRKPAPIFHSNFWSRKSARFLRLKIGTDCRFRKQTCPKKLTTNARIFVRCFKTTPTNDKWTVTETTRWADGEFIGGRELPSVLRFIKLCD